MSTKESLSVYTRPLILADIDACVKLETEAFPEQERCSREKFLYRLSVCPELSLGLFSVAAPNSELAKAATAGPSRPSESSCPDSKEVLLAHAVGTKCVDIVLKDDTMGLPPEFDTSSPKYRDPQRPGWNSSNLSPSPLGHQEAGRTLALHSLGVLPKYQRRGLGRTILTAYIQRMQDAGIVDRIALIAHDHLIKFYEGFSFKNRGQSSVKFGGGGWYDMVLDFSEMPSWQSTIGTGGRVV